MRKHPRSTKQRLAGGLLSLFGLFMLAALFTALAWGYLAPGPESAGLGPHVDGALTESGVHSRVTSVLLNFRAYDTLLECFVLFLGVTVVWSLPPSRVHRQDPPIGLVLSSLIRLLVPLMVLSGGYLLWAGTNQAGGAFQAGAILGGGGVLLLLSSSPLLAAFPGSLLSWGICLGPFFFLLVAAASLGLGGNVLEYRGEAAAVVIALLEAVAAFSIGLSLAGLFGGRRPADSPQGKGEEP